MRIALGVLMLLHGIAHLPGFVVPWRLATLAEMPYRTTVLDGRLDVGTGGVRAVGALWLLAALGFGAAAAGAFTQRDWWRLAAFAATIASLGLCALGWPDSRLGVPVNVVMLAMLGFGCEVVAADPAPAEECRRMGVAYVPLPELLERSHVVALHAPLTPGTHHLLDADAFARMRPGALLVTTSRGAVVDTRAAIAALKAGRLGGLALDVYEGEAELFFSDRSGEVIRDDVFARLLTFPNVIVTGHQAFFTREAMRAIAETTVTNITAFERGVGTLHAVPSAPAP